MGFGCNRETRQPYPRTLGAAGNITTMATRKRTNAPAATIDIQPDGTVTVAMPGCVPVVWRHVRGDPRKAAERVATRLARAVKHVPGESMVGRGA